MASKIFLRNFWNAFTKSYFKNASTTFHLTLYSNLISTGATSYYINKNKIYDNDDVKIDDKINDKINDKFCDDNLFIAIPLCKAITNGILWPIVPYKIWKSPKEFFCLYYVDEKCKSKVKVNDMTIQDINFIRSIFNQNSLNFMIKK
jgi:hypothetical protein